MGRGNDDFGSATTTANHADDAFARVGDYDLGNVYDRQKQHDLKPSQQNNQHNQKAGETPVFPTQAGNDKKTPQDTRGGGNADFNKYQPSVALSGKLKELSDNLDDYSYCTQCAETLMKANNGEGKIIIFGSKDASWERRYSWGLNEVDTTLNLKTKIRNENFTYHSVYTDGRYMYDPFVSSKPISQSEYINILKQQNPNGISWRIKGESDSPDIPELKKGGF